MVVFLSQQVIRCIANVPSELARSCQQKRLKHACKIEAANILLGSTFDVLVYSSFSIVILIFTVLVAVGAAVADSGVAKVAAAATVDVALKPTDDVRMLIIAGPIGGRVRSDPSPSSPSSRPSSSSSSQTKPLPLPPAVIDGGTRCPSASNPLLLASGRRLGASLSPSLPPNGLLTVSEPSSSSPSFGDSAAESAESVGVGKNGVNVGPGASVSAS